jgi:hypothetical protein
VEVVFDRRVRRRVQHLLIESKGNRPLYLYNPLLSGSYRKVAACSGRIEERREYDAGDGLSVSIRRLNRGGEMNREARDGSRYRVDKKSSDEGLEDGDSLGTTR